MTNQELADLITIASQPIARCVSASFRATADYNGPIYHAREQLSKIFNISPKQTEAACLSYARARHAKSGER